MKKQYPYLNDLLFLEKIASEVNTIHYVKVNLLTWEDEIIIKDIAGKVTDFPNITIDGSSAIRRTANISFLIEEDYDQDVVSILSLNKKIYLEIGQDNPTTQYAQYPILWFPMGVFIIADISFSKDSSGVKASLSLRDKMCLLNGEFGGTIPAAVAFDHYEMQDEEGNIREVQPTIYRIIVELVNHFGGEQLGKIIIADIDTRIKRVMQWTASSPLFILKDNTGQIIITINENEANEKISNSNFRNVPGSPFTQGSLVGFTLSDFTYPGDLIGNAGDSVVTILDKIKNILGNYEYFYDVDGNFHFQEIKNYLNNSQSKYILESLNKNQVLPEYLSNLGQAYMLQRNGGKSTFSFKKNKNLVISYANTPKIQNIKNDFVFWGIRKNSIGDFPIRYHLAIDNKPKTGNQYQVVKYKDFYDENSEKWYKPISCNSLVKPGKVGTIYYYNNKCYIWSPQKNNYEEINATVQNITTKDWRTQLFFQGVMSEPNGVQSNFYYSELLAEWPKIYDIEHGKFKEELVKDSTQFNYYLDFINPTSDNMKKIAINNIGRRSLIINKNDDINCIFEPYIPDIVFIKMEQDNTYNPSMSALRQECYSKNYTYSQISADIYDFLITGKSLNSGYEEVKQTLYEYINYYQSITLQTLPIYFLQPNTFIEVEDQETNIKGDYLITQLSYSLDSVSISASKVISKNM